MGKLREKITGNYDPEPQMYTITATAVLSAAAICLGNVSHGEHIVTDSLTTTIIVATTYTVISLIVKTLAIIVAYYATNTFAKTHPLIAYAAYTAVEIILTTAGCFLSLVLLETFMGGFSITEMLIRFILALLPAVLFPMPDWRKTKKEEE